jgi:hypothetical protein
MEVRCFVLLTSNIHWLPVLTNMRQLSLLQGIASSVLKAIEVAELENLVKLHIANGKAWSTLGNGQAGAETLQSALDVSGCVYYVVKQRCFLSWPPV